ncbi:diguanylate cyclase domain-containing protein [Ramlibacter sp.]|uniref:diguanylate cyclase domain-containing protein n=1 Tax=Ramlibacter sp. TaxID=1917967 RepID=UPI003D0E0DA0
MDPVAIGFWGAFFGTAGLMLAASLAAFARSLRRVALMAALSSLVSALFVVAYLGFVPVGDERAQARLLGHVSVVCAVVLALMLLSMLGWLRQRQAARRAVATLLGAGIAVTAAGWALDPEDHLLLGSLAAMAMGGVMLALSVRSAMRGDRLGWAAVSGVSLMLVAVGGLTWIALDRDVAWPVHAASALAGTGYLAVMAVTMWSRYSYLLELTQVMAQGPAYDPVTRMRSHTETSQMIGQAFFHRDRDREQRAMGMLVVSIANLYALENLHGRAAFNHALFVCASRLRRCVPTDVEMGRLGDDGFLLLVPGNHEGDRLAQLARQLRQRLMRPVVLATGKAAADPEHGRTDWLAEVGIGVLSAGPRSRPAQAVAVVRAMSRTAWSYGSRMAWYDYEGAKIAELPLASE